MSSLDPFRDPSSVAVVGASDDQTKWGYWLARGALHGRDRRRVYLINRSAVTVQGEPTYSSVGELPEAPDLVVVCVPPAFVHDLVADSLSKGARAFLGITAGVPDGEDLAALLRDHGARMVGPNSLGIYDSSTALQLAWGHFTPGNLAIVSQSGQLGSEIANLAARAGIGVSRFISVGNQLDVNAAELLDDLIDDPATHLVALYLESFTDGAHLVRTLRALARAGKPTLLLTTGASDGSKRLAQSHTGSLSSALATVDAACRAAGAVRVATPTELVNLARFLSRAPVPAGRRLAVVSDSGGQGGIAADVAAARGLSTPAFSPQLQDNLAELLPAGASVTNPVDLAGAGEADLHTYAEVCERLLGSGEVDAVVLSGYLGCYGEDTPSIEPAELEVVDRLGRIVEQTHAPLVVHSMSAGSRAVSRMWEHDIPAFGGIEFAMDAVAYAAGLHEWPGRDLKQPGHCDGAVADHYWAARGLLDALGIPSPAGRLVRARAELEACTDLTFPVVLKAGWLAHKSEHGGVVLGLATPGELLAAYDEMHERLGDGEYVVEEQDRRRHTVEMLVGGNRDRDFGPVVVVGAGGTEAELHRDVCVELAPVDHATARSMIDRLRCRPLLGGWRGSPAVDVDALADIVVAVSEAIAARPDLSELEVNPIRVAPEGVLAVDALAVATAPAGHHHDDNDLRETADE